MSAAYLVLVGVILGRYADEAVPTYYVLRPLAVAILPALTLGVLAYLLPGPPHAIAALGALALSFSSLTGPAILIALWLMLGSHVLRITGRTSTITEGLGSATLVLASLFAAIGLVRAGAVSDIPEASGPASHAGTDHEPNLYFLLLDGYPREDSLAELGIDNSSFLAQLTAFGFDVYADAESETAFTELSLLSLAYGDAEDLPFRLEGPHEQRSALRALDTAPVWSLLARNGTPVVVIDSPVGHVTFSAGTHVQPGGMNNFEESLLAQSALAQLVREFAPKWPMDSLRGHLDMSLATVEAIVPESGSVALVHLMAPHLPFLWSAKGETSLPAYWPRVQLFESVNEITGLSRQEYASRYRHHLKAINERLFRAVRTLIASDPRAVIVLFSDHGARYSEKHLEEWDRVLLVARTPGNPRLYDAAPHVDQVLCRALAVYREIGCGM